MTARRPGRRLPTTRWTIVLAAGDGRREALQALCATYWCPGYGWLRSQGLPAQAAEDVLQSFFEGLLRRGDLARVSPESGRFRGWFLTGLRHAWSHWRAHGAARKRGGGAVHLPIDAIAAEQRLAADQHADAAERAYDRRWAEAMLDTAREAVAGHYTSPGRARLFAALRPLIEGRALERSYAALAAELDMTEGAVKVAAHRLRRRFGAAVRQAVADTVVDPAEVDDEPAYLRTLLGA